MSDHQQKQDVERRKLSSKHTRLKEDDFTPWSLNSKYCHEEGEVEIKIRTSGPKRVGILDENYEYCTHPLVFYSVLISITIHVKGMTVSVTKLSF